MQSLTTASSSPLHPAASSPVAEAPPTPAVPFDDDLDYIQAELQWLQARAERISADRKLSRMEEGSSNPRRRRAYDVEEESPRTLYRRVESARDREQRSRAELDRRLEAHRASQRPTLALDVLCRSCDLDGFQRMVLLLAVAPCFSTRFEELYGAVCGESNYDVLSVEAVFAMAELDWRGRLERRADFSPSSPLCSQDLVSIGLGHRYEAAKDLLGAEVQVLQRTFAYLVGRTELNDEFREFSSIEEPLATLDQVVLCAEDKRRILSVVENHDTYLQCRRDWGVDELVSYGRGTLMLFHGPPGTGKTMTAHAVAARLGKRVLNVDIPTFVGHREADRFLPSLFREARLQDALLFFDECELLLGSRRAGNALMTLLLTELERFEGIAVLATNMPEQLDEALSRRILVRVHFPAPDRPAREAIWRGLLPAAAPVSGEADLGALAERFELSGGHIKNAVLVAVAAAVHDRPDDPVLLPSHLEEAARSQLIRIDEEGSPLEVPEARTDDLVLEPRLRAKVDDLLRAVRDRHQVVHRWGVGGRSGVRGGLAALLAGPPGTGKTLCAEALAGELHRPLRRVSTPSLLSKWVGETERRVDALFRGARADHAVLFFDEADGLLSRRDEEQISRHDRSLVGLLLQRIESYPGLVLLATNLPDLLDSALARRLWARLDFPPPGPEERRLLWEKMVPESAPRQGLLDFRGLARRHELSGAQIRTAALRAATRAAARDLPIDMLGLERAAEEVSYESNPRGL